MAQITWKVTIDGRQGAAPTWHYDVTRFAVRVVAQTRAAAKAAALAYVMAKTLYLEETGPFRVVSSRQEGEWMSDPSHIGQRAEGEVIGFEVSFARR
jgi:hypothetical protein